MFGSQDVRMWEHLRGKCPIADGASNLLLQGAVFRSRLPSIMTSAPQHRDETSQPAQTSPSRGPNHSGPAWARELIVLLRWRCLCFRQDVPFVCGCVCTRSCCVVFCRAVLALCRAVPCVWTPHAPLGKLYRLGFIGSSFRRLHAAGVGGIAIGRCPGWTSRCV